MPAGALVVGSRAETEGSRSRSAELEARLGKDSGKSPTPPLRDGRDRRAEERDARKKARIDPGGGVDRPIDTPTKRPPTARTNRDTRAHRASLPTAEQLPTNPATPLPLVFHEGIMRS